mmetsp:Transcript_69539/g.165853  ORF Transcript_69539/g.165853 Transcript_69539/m.165853 type:complete len:216 (-) Transcript_69539:188-835(-)
MAFQSLRISTSVLPVHKVVGTHGRKATGIDGPLKRRVIRFEESAVVHLGIHIRTDRLLMVGNEMLHDSQDVLRVHTLDIARDKLCSQIARLPGQILYVAAVAGNPVYVEPRPEQDIRTFKKKLSSQGFAPSSSKVSIPSRSHSQRGWPGGHLRDLSRLESSVALPVVLEIQRRDALTGNWVRVPNEEAVGWIPGPVRISHAFHQAIDLRPIQLLC